MGNEKVQVSYGSLLKAELGNHESGLPGWPMPPLGDWTGEFGCHIEELWAGVNRSKTITRLVES